MPWMKGYDAWLLNEEPYGWADGWDSNDDYGDEDDEFDTDPYGDEWDWDSEYEEDDGMDFDLLDEERSLNIE